MISVKILKTVKQSKLHTWWSIPSTDASFCRQVRRQIHGLLIYCCILPSGCFRSHIPLCVYVYNAAPVQITIFGAIYNICNILNKRKQNLNISNFSVVFKYKFNQYQYIIHGRKVKNGNVSFQHKALI